MDVVINMIRIKIVLQGAFMATRSSSIYICACDVMIFIIFNIALFHRWLVGDLPLMATSPMGNIYGNRRHFREIGK